MTSRVGLLGLASLASLALSPSAVNAQASGYANSAPFLDGSDSRATQTGGFVLRDVLVSSMRGGRTVATTRTDGQGRFHLDLPAGDYNICLNGPGLRSVIDRSGGSSGSDNIIGVLIGLLLPAGHAGGAEQQRTFPSVGAGLGQSPRGGPPPMARDLCFPYVVNAGVQTTRGQRVMPDGSIMSTGDPAIRQTGPGSGDLDSDGRPDRDFNGQDPAEPGSTGDADRRADPRIPPPGIHAAPPRPAALQTVSVTGTVRLVR